MRASERSYRQLREEILAWRLAPGTPLAETELAGRLGVSRTPLREALARLTADGLAAPVGGRGLVVSTVSLDDIEQLFELRLALEQQAARLAALRRESGVFRHLLARFEADSADLDEEHYFDLVGRMDEAIDDATGNRYLVAGLRTVRVHLARIRRLAKNDTARLAAAADEHRLILTAILERDPELAAHATHVHLHNAQTWLRQHAQDAPTPEGAAR